MLDFIRYFLGQETGSACTVSCISLVCAPSGVEPDGVWLLVDGAILARGALLRRQARVPAWYRHDEL